MLKVIKLGPVTKPVCMTNVFNKTVNVIPSPINENGVETESK